MKERRHARGLRPRRFGRGLAGAAVVAACLVPVVTGGPAATAQAQTGSTPVGTKPDTGRLTPALAVLGQTQPPGPGQVAPAELSPIPDNRPGGLRRLADGRLLVDVRVDDTGPQILDRLAAVGDVVAVSQPALRTVTVAVADGDLRRLGAVEGVQYLTEVLSPVTRAACTPLVSEADVQLRAALARSQSAVDGTGVTVGILSDSFDRATGAATTAAQDVAAGELPGPGNPCGRPGPVNRVDDSASPGSATDEGRAMAQAVHDLAPAAGIAFATAAFGETSFANNIGALVTAGAKVIVDDVGYSAEPFYQDGPVSVAINNARAAGVTYLAAAGNSNVVLGGQEVGSYEALTWRPTACPSLPLAFLDCHNFSAGGVDSRSGMVVPPNRQLVLDLQWAQPRGGVTTDIDLFLLDAATGAVLGSGTRINDGSGTQQPFELAGYLNQTGAPVSVNVVVGRFAGPPARFKWIHFGEAPSSVEYSTPTATDVFGPTIWGHSGAAAALSVGAVHYSDPSAAEVYSSRGPVTVLFAPVPATAPLATPQVLVKPDLAATDCVANTLLGSGSPRRFCGTSNAAPHAAAVAALVLDAASGLAPAQVGSALRSTARAVGAHPATVVGAGLVDAAAAVASVLPSPVLAGAAFYSDGTSSRSGPSGTRISVFATSAEPGFPYRLVTGRTAPTSTAPCTADVVPVVPGVRFTGATGVLAQAAGPIVRPPGQWQVCFLAAGETVTGAATFTVTP